MYHQLSLNKFNTFCFSVSLTLINTNCWQEAACGQMQGTRGVHLQVKKCAAVERWWTLRLEVAGGRARRQRGNASQVAPRRTTHVQTFGEEERCHVKHSLLEEQDREDIQISSAAGHFSRSLTTGEHSTCKPWIRAHLRSDSYWGLLVSLLIQSS